MVFNIFGGNDDDGGSDDETERLPSRDERQGQAEIPDNDQYAVDLVPRTRNIENDRSISVQDAHGDVYAGQWIRDNFHKKAEDGRSQDPIWTGWRSSKQNGVVPIGIPFNSWFRHCAIFGTTGYGKTTLINNQMTQLAYAGHGFTFIDPKGDAAHELLSKLPENRLDDVIWIEPAPKGRDRVVGLNFLEVGESVSEQDRANEINSLQDDLRGIIESAGGGHQWGARMADIFDTISQGMMESKKPYTLIDMFYVLKDEQKREAFIKEIDDPIVQESAAELNDMDDKELRPILRRLRKLVMNQVTREIVGHKEASVNIKDAIESGKIIIVRPSVSNASIKRLLTTGIMRRVWAAIKARTEQDENERSPYFMIVDEFDKVVDEETAVGDMISRARSFNLSLTLCNQQPHQLPRNIKEYLFSMDNMIAFNPGHPNSAGEIAKKLGDVDREQINNQDRYEVFTEVSTGKGKKGPFQINTLPPYPPLRGEVGVNTAIDRSLDEYGTDRLDPKEAVEDLVINNSPNDGGPTEARVTTGSDGVTGDKQQVNISKSQLLSSAYAVSFRQHKAPGEFVAIDRVLDELEGRVDAEFHESEPADLIEQLQQSSDAKVSRRDGTLYIRLKESGVKYANGGTSGSGASSGGIDHHNLVQRSFELFTAAGFSVTRENQDDEGELPDLLAQIPMDMTATNQAQMRENIQRLRQNYPGIAAVTDGRDVSIEVETSTTKTKPAQALKNLRKAVNAGRECVFAVQPGADDPYKTARKAAQNLLLPPLVRHRQSSGAVQFYNTTDRLAIADDVYVVRQASTGNGAVWWKDGQTGEVALTPQGSGEKIYSFDSVQDIHSVSRDDVTAYCRVDRRTGKYIVRMSKQIDGEQTEEKFTYDSKKSMMENWKWVYSPFVPQAEFDRMPESDDWEIVILPDDRADDALHYQPRVENGQIKADVEPLFAGIDQFGQPDADQPTETETSTPAQTSTPTTENATGEATTTQSPRPENAGGATGIGRGSTPANGQSTSQTEEAAAVSGQAEEVATATETASSKGESAGESDLGSETGRTVTPSESDMGGEMVAGPQTAAAGVGDVQHSSSPYSVESRDEVTDSPSGSPDRSNHGEGWPPEHVAEYNGDEYHIVEKEADDGLLEVLCGKRVRADLAGTPSSEAEICEPCKTTPLDN